MRVAILYNNLIRGNLPFGITAIAAFIRDHGHIHDYFYSDMEYNDLKDQIALFKPDVLSYSASTGCIPGYLSVNRRLKQDFPNVRSIFGGPHTILRPDFIREAGVDAVCIGEGEYAMQEYLDALEKGKEPTGILNLWIKHPDGTIEKNKTRPFIQDLDSLPFPDYAFIEKFEDLVNSRIAYIMAGRGCPYKCNYCINHFLCQVSEGAYVRYRSVDNVINEIKRIVAKYHSIYVNFQDDTFATNINWMREFAGKYSKEVNLPYSCHLTANLVKEELVDLLHQSNCDMVIIGLENGNERLRFEILNKHTTDEDLLCASRLVRERGIKLVTQNMVGIPGETIDSALKTIELNILFGTFVFNMWFFQPYPMIRLTEMAEEMGLLPRNYPFPRSIASHVALNLPNKETIQLLGDLSYYLVEHPRRFKATKLLLKVFRGSIISRLWLRHLFKIQGVKRKSFDYYYRRWVDTVKNGGDPRSVSL